LLKKNGCHNQKDMVATTKKIWLPQQKNGCHNQKKWLPQPKNMVAATNKIWLPQQKNMVATTKKIWLPQPKKMVATTKKWLPNLIGTLILVTYNLLNDFFLYL